MITGTCLEHFSKILLFWLHPLRQAHINSFTDKGFIICIIYFSWYITYDDYIKWNWAPYLFGGIDMALVHVHNRGFLSYNKPDVKHPTLCHSTNKFMRYLVILDDYVIIMLSQNFLPCITLPARTRDDSMTLMDPIYTRLPNKKLDIEITFGNLYCDIADHMAH